MNMHAQTAVAYCTGWGQNDTHAVTLSDGRPNPHKSAGTPYGTITGEEIAALVENPPSVEKETAQWFIPSTYTKCEGRNHDQQRQNGAFHWLALDLDKNSLSLEDVIKAIGAVTGPCSHLIYSTRSSTPDNRKWRALVPLETPLSGADYSDTQSAFFDLLEQASAGVLIPDRALERPAQLVYLPNKGAYYASHVDRTGKLQLAGHKIIQYRDQMCTRRAQAEAEAKAEQTAKAAKAAQQKAKVQSGEVSPVDHFNAAHCVADLLERYGYTRAGHGDDYRSPMQTSGSYATRDMGDYWISLSGSDGAAEIGMVTKNGHRCGDAFDLFCHFEHGGDFSAAVRAYAPEAGLDRQERETPETGPHTGPQAGKPQGSAAKGDPVDLWGSFDPPELPQGLLPSVIEQFARTNGDQMGADPAGLAVAALVTCAAAIPDKVQIKVKRHDDWTESARLWAALVGPPSAKKSPIISAATGPLCRLDVGMMRDWMESLKKFEAIPAEDRKGQQRPVQTRLRLEDVTVEAAQQVLEGSPWGVLMLQDEMSGFFGAMDKYNGGKGASADRAFWLRSFNGGQFAINRVGRGAAIIDNLSVSMLGGIQPEPLRKIAGSAVDDGLLQRLFPIVLHNATMGRDEPVPPVNSQYGTLIENLRELTTPGWMEMAPLQFDDGAQAIRRDLEARHLELQSLERINRKLASHIGKYDGLFARLCVVWHCVEHVESTMLCDDPSFDGKGLPTTVTEATAQRVATFLHKFLLAHAIAFYGGILGLSDDHDRLTAIAGHILTHKLEQITNRDVQRGDRTMRGLKDHEIRPLLEQLAALGWLDRIDPPRPSSPPHWQVNPAAHTSFTDRAARETERRSKARDTIRELLRGDK